MLLDMEQIIKFLKDEIAVSSARVTAARMDVSHTWLLKLVSGKIKNPGWLSIKKAVKFQGKPFTINPE